MRLAFLIVSAQEIEPGSTTAAITSSSPSLDTGEIRPLRFSSGFPDHVRVLAVSLFSVSALPPTVSIARCEFPLLTSVSLYVRMCAAMNDELVELWPLSSLSSVQRPASASLTAAACFLDRCSCLAARQAMLVAPRASTAVSVQQNYFYLLLPLFS
jgi:hypothetical protein